MSSIERRTVWSVATVALTLVLATATGAAAATVDSATRTGQPDLYVANRGASSITVYRGDSAGAVRPVATIAGARTGQADPWGLAFDRGGNLYVQDYLSSSQTSVYRRGATGNAAPTRVFDSVDGTRDSPSVAVDAAGTVYVPRFDPTPSIEVYPPGATGDTAPERTIVTDGYPRSLAIDSHNRLVVAMLETPAGNAIETFAPGAEGAAAPIRRISGPRTHLGNGQGYGGFSGDSIVLTYSALTDQIYVGVSGCDAPTVATHVSVFPRTGTGDLPPLRTLQGGATGFTRFAAIDGIAVNPHSGDIDVLNTRCQSGGSQGPGRVSVFGRLANGNTDPVRTFTDAATGFTDTQAIAFAP